MKKDKIIVNLKGGLGNQLFQYACGRALSLQNKADFGLDINGFDRAAPTETARKYALGVFKIKAGIATEAEILKTKYPFGIVSKGMRFIRAKILRQFIIGYDKKVLTWKGDVYLDGFFQSEKYFSQYSKEILADIQLKQPCTTHTVAIIEEIRSKKNSISLHIRRGDYVKDKTTNLYHGTCGPEYYAKALQHVTNKIGTDVHIFVFSDDIVWVHENMPLAYPCTYVSDVTKIPDYEELICMSTCMHNIIANSSYSWLGAWLNQNKYKIVVAPSPWTRDIKNSPKEIIPDNWTIIGE